jgi:nitroreductase/NAD-dependent dihydropyrimidine dehydrogenase PreA subunit
MGLLTIDESKCKKDGICVKECPSGIIRLGGEETHPRVEPEDEIACSTCGHCVAVCPQGALSHSRMPMEECTAIKNELWIDHEQAVQFLRSRRSTRQFQDKPVEKDKILRLIEIARYAPTSGNTQLVEWVVFTDRNQLKEFSRLTVNYLREMLREAPRSAIPPYVPRVVSAWDAGHDGVLRNAPVLILASAPREAVNGMVDLTLSMSYLDLAAPTLGLGTCWAGLLQRGLLQWPPLKEAFSLPDAHVHHFPMMLGYSKAKYYRLPERKPPRIEWR